MTRPTLTLDPQARAAASARLDAVGAKKVVSRRMVEIDVTAFQPTAAQAGGEPTEASVRRALDVDRWRRERR